LHREHNELIDSAALLEHAVFLTDNADYRLTLIAVLMQLHRFGDAIIHSADGFQTHPKDIRLAFSKAEAHIAAGEFDLALKWCSEQDRSGTQPNWPLQRYRIYNFLKNDTEAAIEYQEYTRRQILEQNDYRNKAISVLSSITDQNARNKLTELWESKLKKLPTRSVKHLSKVTLPRVAMSILVRDEADIIAENIRYHAACGVEQFIVTDNGSVDGTREILAQLQQDFSLEIIDEPSHTIDQDLWVTRMAQQLKLNSDCDWVIHNDADEFWVPENGSIPEAIRSAQDAQCNVGVLSCKRSNMLTDKQHIEAPGYKFYHNCYATIKTIPLLDGEQRWSGEDSNCVARLVMDKVLTKIDGLGGIEYGNHGAEHTMPIGNCSTIKILHYPVRTYQQFERKVVNYGESLAQNARFTGNSSLHLRYWYERYLEGRLKDDYDSVTFDKARLQALLRNGHVVRDTRVQSFFQAKTKMHTTRAA